MLLLGLTFWAHPRLEPLHGRLIDVEVDVDRIGVDDVGQQGVAVRADEVAGVDPAAVDPAADGGVDLRVAEIDVGLLRVAAYGGDFGGGGVDVGFGL